jgi:hypothetical protein
MDQAHFDLGAGTNRAPSLELEIPLRPPRRQGAPRRACHYRSNQFIDAFGGLRIAAHFAFSSGKHHDGSPSRYQAYVLSTDYQRAPQQIRK